jgi:putative DNA primase/helicase
MGGSKPTICTSPLWENIPPELQALPHWILWRWVQKPDGKWTKPPLQPDGRNAKADDPNTWASFDFVRTAFDTALGNGHRFDGVGFVLTAQDPFCGFDFDNCLNTSGEITLARVAEFVAALNSYTEVSPSFTGLRVIVRAKLPPGGRKKGDFECYDDRRYLTITGNIWPRS